MVLLAKWSYISRYAAIEALNYNRQETNCEHEEVVPDAKTMERTYLWEIVNFGQNRKNKPVSSKPFFRVKYLEVPTINVSRDATIRTEPRTRSCIDSIFRKAMARVKREPAVRTWRSLVSDILQNSLPRPKVYARLPSVFPSCTLQNQHVTLSAPVELQNIILGLHQHLLLFHSPWNLWLLSLKLKEVQTRPLRAFLLVGVCHQWIVWPPLINFSGWSKVSQHWTAV